MELTDRKKQILKIVVDGYVATAEPVSSKAIAEKMPGRISSATIRNELADLVEMGYLEQPHTSAGRVPSAKGYRLYVNELMERRALPEDRKKLRVSSAAPNTITASGPQTSEQRALARKVTLRDRLSPRRMEQWLRTMQAAIIRAMNTRRRRSFSSPAALRQ